MACSSCQRAAQARAGSTASNAIVFGDPEDPVFRVKVAARAGGLMVGAVKYVRGSDVEQMITDGTFVELNRITNIQAKRGRTSKLWYVGEIGFTSLQAAQVLSAQTGETPVEREIGD